ncbi:MAG: protein kinase domain-containing protein [Planctomycetota bacterium]|jgi:serine/threonine-protein kinase
MAEQNSQRGEPQSEADEARLDVGLQAGFGPVPGVADARAGLSVLAEIEGRIGTETRVFLRREDGPGDAPGGEGAAQSPPGGARYEARGEIARGGMGVIVRSHDTDLGRDVAMKVLQPRHADNEAMVRRFVEEAQIAGQLQHPGVLTVYELGLQPDRRPYFTMRLIKGRTLAELLDDRSGPDQDRRRFLSVFERVCQTMAYAHARGVIHRDLKPANVMVAEFGEIQIVDWGLAKLLPRDDANGPPRVHADDETEIQLPQTEAQGSHSIAGSIMGTPAYMPPEQARGEIDQVDERADVFALGAILCEILTGTGAYTGDASASLEAAKEGRLEGAWTCLDACGADDELVALVKSCLAPNRRERVRHAGVVADRLTAYLASVDERARASELAAAKAGARAAEERRRRRLTLTWAAVMLAAVVVGGSIVVWSQNQRLQNIAAASDLANERLNELTRLLEEARATPASESRSWVALRAAGAHVSALRGAVALDEATRDRASALLDEYSRAERDRRMVERIEDLVIVGATHDDPESWNRMADQIGEAFLDYGIDLKNTAPEEIADRIRASDLTPQLTDGLELWIRARGYPGTVGGAGFTREQMAAWADVLYAADPDPFRVGVRRQIYTERPEALELARLARSEAFETAPPRTLSWLGNCFLRVNDVEAVDDVYRRALGIHPTDFMLNFDYAWSLALLGRWEEATRYYHRALAIRPKNSGIWRRLGLALWETGDLAGAIDALDRSIEQRPDHAPTYVDLGRARAAANDLDAALGAYRTAIGLDPDLAIAHCRLGLALQARGDLAEALEALHRGHELGSATVGWQEPSQEWVDECRRRLESLPEG